MVMGHVSIMLRAVSPSEHCTACGCEKYGWYALSTGDFLHGLFCHEHMGKRADKLDMEEADQKGEVCLGIAKRIV